MLAQRIQILHIIALVAIPFVAAQSEIIDYSARPEMPIDRHVWPKLWFYSGQSFPAQSIFGLTLCQKHQTEMLDSACKAGWSEPEILIDQTDDDACHRLIDRRSLGIQRDPATDPPPQNQASCMFLYKGPHCGGKATMIDVPFNGEFVSTG